MINWCQCGMDLVTGTNFLAHRIRISEILPWDTKSYLTQAILPRLSREGYIHLLYWNSHTWSSSDIIVMFKWHHHVQLHLSVFRDFWKLISKLKKWWARKIIYYLCEGRIEKFVPRDHRFLSLGKPHDAKRGSSGRIFLSYPHTHYRFLLYESAHEILVLITLMSNKDSAGQTRQSLCCSHTQSMDVDEDSGQK